MRIGRLTAFASAFAFASLACDVKTLIGTVPDAGAPGDDDSGVGITDAASDTDAPMIGPGVAVGHDGHLCKPVDFGEKPYTLPAGVAGTWSGQFDGPLMLSSNAFRLSLQSLPDGSGEIHLVMGSLPAPPPATSVTDYYPSAPYNYFPSYVEGFSYPAHHVRWTGMKVEIWIYLADPWESWCGLQTSYYYAGLDQYLCTPSLDPADVCAPGKVACMQSLECSQGANLCLCDACGCSASFMLFEVLEVTFAGDAASGGIISGGSNFTVRLTHDVN